MKYLNKLQIRTVDTHTVLLGLEGRWSRLSLPWVSRDIGMLIAQLEEKNRTDDDPLERLSALKICLTQLQHASQQSNTLIKQEREEAKLFYNEAKVIPLRELIHHKEEQGLIVTARVSELLLNEQAIQNHVGYLSLLLYSDQAVMLSPVILGKDYCPFCYRHLLAIPFGLRTPYKGREEEAFLETGIQLGKMLERGENETLYFEGKAIELEPLLPFIGCPTCHTKAG